MDQYLIAQRRFQLNEVSSGAGTTKAIRLIISRDCEKCDVMAESSMVPGPDPPGPSGSDEGTVVSHIFAVTLYFSNKTPKYRK